MSAPRQKRTGYAVLSLLGASSLALGAVGLAQGASLHKGLWQAGAGESSGDWTVVSNTKMSKVTALSNFKCNRMNAVIPGSLVIHPDRSFSYSGRLKGQAGHITFKGRFTSATKAVGSTVITKGSCNSGKLKWTAKPLTSPVPPATPAPNSGSTYG